MLRVRPDLLRALRCCLCGGVLSCTPVVLKPDEGQVCGRCFRILPPPEQGKCVRQVGYEAAAEMLLFPCRYAPQGCQSEFPLNGADGHELECPFRFWALGDDGDGQRGGCAPGDPKWGAPTPGWASPAPWAPFAALDVSECISVQGRLSLQEGPAPTPSALKYEIDVVGNTSRGATLCLRSSTRNYSNIASHFKNNPLRVSVRGTLSLSSYQNVFCEVVVTPESDSANPYPPPSEPVYETINAPRSCYPKCTKCANHVQTEIYHCSFGHDVCKTCKGNTCMLCTSPMSATPRFCCRNFPKGCRGYLLQSELHLHAKDCEFAERNCLLGCGERCETLADLKDHLKEKHLQGIFMSNAVVRQAAGDESWVILAFDSVFQYKKYVYDGDVEFLVEYVGPHEKANGFKYEVLVKLENEVKITKTSTCRGWNFSALDRALVITESELNKRKIKKKAFNYTLNIIQILKD